MNPGIHAQINPDKPALFLAGSGEMVTYKQLNDRSNQTAHLLREEQLYAGDVIGIFMHNCAQFLEVAWAAQRAGLYYVCASSRLTASELRYILQDSGCRLLIFSAELSQTVGEATEGLAISSYSVNGVRVAGSLEAAREGFSTSPIADEAPGQDMLYSSGTTGRPKGIKLKRREGRIDAAAPVTTLAQDLYGMNRDTIYLCPAPLYHAAPLRFTMAVQQLGGTVIIMEKFEPENALWLIEKYRITHAQWVPTHFVRMLKLPSELRDKYDLTSLICALHAGAPCPIEIKQQMIGWWGAIVHEYYSNTELNGFTAATADEWTARRGTVGRAVIGRIRICDPAGEPLPPRVVGNVYFEGGNRFEYHNDPEKTEAAYNQYGWSTAGDIGWIDEDGYLYLTDRASFMIITGGVNVYPQEVENILITHPKVADAAVIGAPDADFGERVVAVIEPLDWNDAGGAFASELMVWIKSKVSPIKAPRQIDFMRKLPREPTGKLFKRLIRDAYRAGPDKAPDGIDEIVHGSAVN